ncbi:MAG: hypothetical protein M3Y71_03975, partial [Actinomycetota bacterium]|nr:hypothetical protein [Actinomycetota bacterium]
MSSTSEQPAVQPARRPAITRAVPPAVPRRVTAVRALGTAAALTTATLGVALARVAVDARDALTRTAAAAPDEVLIGLVAGVGAALCLWLGMGFVVSLGSALPGQVGGWSRRLSERITPLAVRRVAAAVLGGALVATGAAPA